MALLEANNLSRSFGGVTAVQDVSFVVRRGQIKAVIGPNGAGKTTLFNILCGITRPDKGNMLFNGASMHGLKPYQIARLGISRTFQNLSLFLNMTVLENVMIGRHSRTRSGIFSAAFRMPSSIREERSIRASAMTYLDSVGLAGIASRTAGSLSFGQRRMLELARALATEPTLLLLDEPASGLNPRETDELGIKIRSIRDSGVTVLLVEHDMSLVMEISDEILVLNFGAPIAEGSPYSIRNDPNVISVYLGGADEDA